ncbi:MAG: GNAT family N-acetyltransferase [Clostridia bacterium]|nr:GNAT family N-acetyltransferase [Clostridia bacterium]
MIVRRANTGDIDGINKLLRQVLSVHHEGRPDLFKSSGKKYTDSQLEYVICSDDTPVFVAVNDSGLVLGHAFCQIKTTKNSNVLKSIKTLYLDDLCIDKNARGQHIGTLLYEQVVSHAKELGCYNVTLNVWSCNENAMKFYESCGLAPQSVTMEKIL